MTRADKRARQKERTRQAKEAREAALKRERRRSIVIRVGVSLLIVAILIGITAIVTGGGDDDTSATDTTVAGASLPEGCVDTAPEENPDRPTSFPKAPAMTIDPAKTYTANMSTSCGDITIALDAKSFPTSVNNFVFLANEGFFDGLQWVRAATDFVIQSGSPTNTQDGDPGYEVKAEVPAQPGYAPGAVAWGKGGPDPAGTAGSQFFIVTGSGGASLPADYGMIGTVSAGLENAQKMATLAPEGGDGPPTIPVYINSVEIVES